MEQNENRTLHLLQKLFYIYWFKKWNNCDINNLPICKSKNKQKKNAMKIDKKMDKKHIDLNKQV